MPHPSVKCFRCVWISHEPNGHKATKTGSRAASERLVGNATGSDAERSWNGDIVQVPNDVPSALGLVPGLFSVQSTANTACSRRSCPITRVSFLRRLALAKICYPVGTWRIVGTKRNINELRCSHYRSQSENRTEPWYASHFASKARSKTKAMFRASLPPSQEFFEMADV